MSFDSLCTALLNTLYYIQFNDCPKYWVMNLTLTLSVTILSSTFRILPLISRSSSLALIPPSPFFLLAYHSFAHSFTTSTPTNTFKPPSHLHCCLPLSLPSFTVFFPSQSLSPLSSSSPLNSIYALLLDPSQLPFTLKFLSLILKL